ncbi:alpha/beta hydrolase [Dietzia sp. B32]|uniref:alpha/beta hydrolase n=1 Tax=Dietzia sp. B32 TaxID=2915130 RepID=UPI0021AD9D0D|nr:alpha/beta hydrolase [Dietzia sp. B32]UVE93833.1 alpha/beta hydrolase [Dietzia sp. B32]
MREIGATDLRTRRSALLKATPPPQDVSTVEDVHVVGRDGDIPVRRYRPSTNTKGAIIYFHGGGWVLGSVEESDGFCRYLSALSGLDVFSVDYRLAPEHKFPAAFHDARDAVDWISGIVPSELPLVLMGDSSGGNLVAAVTHEIARTGKGPRIDMQALVYPVLDHSMSTPSYREHGSKYLISADDMAWFWDNYAPDVSRRDDHRLSPAMTDDLANVAPTLLVVAEYDTMRDEALAYAQRLEESGVETVVHRYDDMAHGFFPMYAALDTSDMAIRALADVLAQTKRR